jgi:hypothetical protein
MTPTPIDRAARWARWLGPLVALGAVASYFTLFVRWPATRDFPWVNLALLALALGLSLRGLRGFASAKIPTRAGAATSLALSGALSAFFAWYCFSLSYALPGEERALAVGAPAPQLSLRDHLDRDVDLAAAARQPLVLVFYRGHW